MVCMVPGAQRDLILVSIATKTGMPVSGLLQKVSTAVPELGDETKSLRMVKWQHDGWALGLVMTREDLNEIMNDGMVSTFMISKLPRLGRVPTVAISIVSAGQVAADGGIGVCESIVVELLKSGFPKPHAVCPIPISLEVAAYLRKYRVVVTNFFSGSPLNPLGSPEWNRMNSIVLFYAETKAQAIRLAGEHSTPSDKWEILDLDG